MQQLSHIMKHCKCPLPMFLRPKPTAGDGKAWVAQDAVDDVASAVPWIDLMVPRSNKKAVNSFWSFEKVQKTAG